jgi:hypothetical protein
MSQSLILEYGDEKIAVVRDTYERAVWNYIHSLDFIGFDNWLLEGNLLCQKKLYKDCNHFIDFKDWKNELQLLNLHPKDTSIMEGQSSITDYKNWYTLKSIQVVFHLYSDELNHFGFSY